MTTFDQFTKTGASISVIWSTSRGADNYTITVTPPVMPGQSDLTTTATSLKVILVYNVNYSINITAQNCVGSNSSIVPLIVGEVMAYLYVCPNYAKKNFPLFYSLSTTDYSKESCPLFSARDLLF